VLLPLLVGCAAPATEEPPQPPAAVVLTSVTPELVAPNTRLVLHGTNFAESTRHVLHLTGTRPSGNVDLQADVSPASFDQGEVLVDSTLFAGMGEGTFQGEVWVVSSNAVGETAGQRLPTTLTFAEHLDPTLREVGDGLVHLNSRVTVLGSGFLLGDKEGTATVEIEGCFQVEGATGSCDVSGKKVTTQVPATPQMETDRRQAYFEFHPSIAGLTPGVFDGTVAVVNKHPDGVETRSNSVKVHFELARSRIYRVDQKAVSLGQHLDIRGAGFVGGDKASTLVHFSGTFAPHDGDKPRQITFDLVPGYHNGGWVRHVVEESLGIGSAVKLRRDYGMLDGTWTPTVYWGNASEQGLPIKLTLKVAPVKQVVWVRFTKGWHEGLGPFGFQAADQQIRQRILEVMRRDYEGINVDVRQEEPTDFELYVKVDLGGKDPNGLGLLGYDNTPGKDVDNKRLYDWLGGVNALTQQDGYPGYGGVFLESMLGFSEHPPAGIFKSPLSSKLFDDTFDPFRPDRGKVLTSSEALFAGTPESTSGCPAPGDRLAQARCAIRILGNIVGSTASHELGHSLGLADPYGPPTEYHNPGDLPNRLMEGGQGRPLAERAELEGQGPAVFCDDEYLYLKKILPLDPPKDPMVSRPGCY